MVACSGCVLWLVNAVPAVPLLQFERGVRVIIHTANLIYPGRWHDLLEAGSVLHTHVCIPALLLSLTPLLIPAGQMWIIQTLACPLCLLLAPSCLLPAWLPRPPPADNNNKTQALWFQDFPPKDAASPPSSHFETDLAAYLAELRLPVPAARHARDLLARHDFSPARGRLVGSVPGRFTGAAVHSWGHKKLQAVLNREQFPAAFRGTPVVAQFSSLGSIKESYLRELTGSLTAGMAVGGQRLGAPPAGAAGLHIIWPQADEVRNSLEGWFAGGSIPGRKDNVERDHLRRLYHRHVLPLPLARLLAAGALLECPCDRRWCHEAGARAVLVQVGWRAGGQAASDASH